MADKDDFKFDDDDAFAENDLSGAFAEGEQSTPEEPEYPMTIKKAGGSRARVLLLLLLLVVAAGGGYYYFMMMEEPAPPPPPAKKAVAVAPKPKPAAAPLAQPAAPPGNQAKATPPPAQPASPAPAAVAVAPPPKQAKPSSPASSAAVAAVAKPAPAPAAAKPAETNPAATGGPWLVDAGTYTNAAALKSAEKKVRALGYEPQVGTAQKSLHMTRVRVGAFAESEAGEALAYARGIAPDAFILRSGTTSTVYAGTFSNAQNARQMMDRFTSEGVQVAEEPVMITRTISTVRFGGFADQTTAAEVAAKARQAGLAAEVVNAR